MLSKAHLVDRSENIFENLSWFRIRTIVKIFLAFCLYLIDRAYCKLQTGNSGRDREGCNMHQRSPIWLLLGTLRSHGRCLNRSPTGHPISKIFTCLHLQCIKIVARWAILDYGVVSFHLIYWLDILCPLHISLAVTDFVVNVCINRYTICFSSRLCR